MPASPFEASGAPALGLVNAGEPRVEAAVPHAMISIKMAATISIQPEPTRGRLFTFPPIFLTNELFYPL